MDILIVCKIATDFREVRVLITEYLVSNATDSLEKRKKEAQARKHKQSEE